MIEKHTLSALPVIIKSSLARLNATDKISRSCASTLVTADFVLVSHLQHDKNNVMSLSYMCRAQRT